MMTITELGRATMTGYVDALVTRGSFADFFTDDVTLDMIGAGQSAQGRAQVEGFIRFGHEQAFDGRPELKSMTVDPDGSRAALEIDFVGRHTGEFAGIPATGRVVHVPYSVHYDLEDGRISALRIYGLADGLVSAIS
jgi:predicted ester cyclase